MTTNNTNKTTTNSNQTNPVDTKDFNRFFWRKVFRIGLGFVAATIIIKEWDELKGLIGSFLK